MDERSEKPRNVLIGFAGMTLMAMAAWLFGSPILGVALSLGAIFSLVVSLTGNAISLMARNRLPKLSDPYS